MKRYSGPRTNPRILSVTLQGNKNMPPVQGRDDVKSSEARGALTRLPGGAGRPNHDDVKSCEKE